MKTLKKNELSDQLLDKRWQDDLKGNPGYSALETGARYQPEHATDELPYQASAPIWPGYPQSDSPLAG